MMKKYPAADRLRGAISHLFTISPLEMVAQVVWLERHHHGWLRDAVHSLDGKTIYVRRNGRLFSFQRSPKKP